MATSASGIYSDTLQSIVDAKLNELERKRSAFEQAKAQLLHQAAGQNSDSDKLRTLVDGVKALFSIRSSEGRLVHGSSKYGELELKLANLERFLAQPRYDPSVSAGMLREWEHDLHQQLDVQSSRFEYASLYGQLVTEWLVADKKIGVKLDPGEDLDMSGFEEIESKQMMEARAKWAADVFKPRNTDVNAIQSYLSKLFGENGANKQTFKALQALRRKVVYFENELSQPDQFSEYVLKWVINGLLATDLLTEEKRNVLRDFLANSIILNELADVLNLRLASLDTWSWGERVPLEQKRKIQGHFEIVMHEDLLQAILLQYIGVKWSVFFKNALTEFTQHDGAWISDQKSVPLEDLKRREYYLGYQSRQESLQAKRNAFWRSFYFMCQLPTSETEDNETGEGEIEADFAPPRAMQMMQQAPLMAAPAAPMVQAAQSYQTNVMALQQQHKKRKMMARQSMPANPNEIDGIKKPKNPTQSRQMLLHFLSSEILTNTHLHGNLTAFRGQYERWNPLLPHSTVLAVMNHLGVSSRWNRFFKTFLEAPLSFKDETEIHHRKRGVPGSHALSDMLGEALLFCLDLKINQSTRGERLWRVHDDFWFWSADHQTTVAAWREIESFSELMGLTLDLDKSGSARAGLQAGQIGKELPQSGIRWGFLFLNSTTGRFEIDQKMVDRHVAELHRQLSAKTSSVFSWVEAWNAYANTFFTTNFGKSANCFGQQHIDDVLATLERAQRNLFKGPDDDAASSVVEYLKQTLATRFGIQDVPEGYVFFPSALGGLELRNPFVLLLQLRDAVTKNPQTLLQQFSEDEQEQYRFAKARFEKGEVGKNGRHYPQYVPSSGPDVFFSFDEYTRYREEFEQPGGASQLSSVYTQLLQRPNEEGIDASTEITTALGLMDTGGVVSQPGKCGINGNWYDMEPYWKWILGLHGPQILRKFGGLNIVDNGVLPIGMVSLFRSQGVSWTG